MKVILYDLDETNANRIAARCDRALSADGRYAPCQGCFGCRLPLGIANLESPRVRSS